MLETAATSFVRAKKKQPEAGLDIRSVVSRRLKLVLPLRLESQLLLSSLAPVSALLKEEEEGVD